jgi:hypothetical protein
MTNRGRGCGRFFCVGDELDVLELETEIVHRFVNHVGILFADVAKLSSGHANEQHALFGVTITCGFQPGGE